MPSAHPSRGEDPHRVGDKKRTVATEAIDAELNNLEYTGVHPRFSLHPSAMAPKRPPARSARPAASRCGSSPPTPTTPEPPWPTPACPGARRAPGSPSRINSPLNPASWTSPWNYYHTYLIPIPRIKPACEAWSAKSSRPAPHRRCSRVETVTHELLDDMAGSHQTDLMRTFAYPLPMAVLCEVTGVPIADREQLRGWLEARMSNDPAQIMAAIPSPLVHLRDLCDSNRQQTPTPGPACTGLGEDAASLRVRWWRSPVAGAGRRDSRSSPPRRAVWRAGARWTWSASARTTVATERQAPAHHIPRGSGSGTRRGASLAQGGQAAASVLAGPYPKHPATGGRGSPLCGSRESHSAAAQGRRGPLSAPSVAGRLTSSVRVCPSGATSRGQQL